MTSGDYYYKKTSSRGSQPDSRAVKHTPPETIGMGKASKYESVDENISEAAETPIKPLPEVHEDSPVTIVPPRRSASASSSQISRLLQRSYFWYPRQSRFLREDSEVYEEIPATIVPPRRSARALSSLLPSSLHVKSNRRASYLPFSSRLSKKSAHRITSTVHRPALRSARYARVSRNYGNYGYRAGQTRVVRTNTFYQFVPLMALRNLLLTILGGAIAGIFLMFYPIVVSCCILVASIITPALVSAYISTVSTITSLFNQFIYIIQQPNITNSVQSVTGLTTIIGILITGWNLFWKRINKKRE